MCYHKIICFWQTGCWVTYAWLDSPETTRKAVQFWKQASCSCSGPHTQNRPLQSFPWFLFWAASIVSAVSQAPPKKWHILRPDAWDSKYWAVIISRTFFFFSFFLSERRGRLFLAVVECLNILPPVVHTNHSCQILQFQPRRGGVWIITVPLLAMLHWLPLTAPSLRLNAKQGYHWVIDNAWKKLVWSSGKVCNRLFVSL